jgi:hypothetical protein
MGRYKTRETEKQLTQKCVKFAVNVTVDKVLG